MSIPWANPIVPYPKQDQAIFQPPQNAVIEAAPKTGKTIGALQWLISETERNGAPGRRYLWVAPTNRISDIGFRRAYMDLLDRDAIKVHRTDRTVTLPSECVIFFGSADKDDHLYGEDYWGIVVDEATRVSLEAWIAITSTTNHTNARYRLIGNVKRQRNWAQKLARKVQRGEVEGWEWHRLTEQDGIEGGVVDEEANRQIRQLIPEDDFRTLYGATDEAERLLFIDTFKLRERELPEVALECRAWDFAVTSDGDWTVGVKVKAGSEGYWFTDVVRARLEPFDVVELVKQTATLDGPACDQVVEEELGASGPLMGDLLRRELDPIPTAGAVYTSKAEQMKRMRAFPMIAAIGASRYFIAPDARVSDLLEEFDAWPDSQHDDIVDAASHAHNHLSPLVEGMVGSSYVPGRDQ